MTPATPDDSRTDAPPPAPADGRPAVRASKASGASKGTKTKAGKAPKGAKAPKAAKAPKVPEAPTPTEVCEGEPVIERGPAPVAGPAAAPEPEVAAELADTLATGGLPGPTSPEALAAWLVGRRWYAGDASPSGEALEVSLATVALPVDPPLATGLVDTHRGERYQLVVPRSADADRPDVGDDPGAAAVLARWIAAGGTSAAGPSGRVVGHWLEGTAPLGDGGTRPLGGEQSNTSVLIGGTHVLKLFRRLQAGPHPEIEVGRHLAHAADAGTSAPVARLAGWYEHEAGGDVTALGVLQDLVPGALDAWGLVLSGLAGDPGGLLARLHRLGAAVAELHGALALRAHGGSEPADAGAPEAFGAVPLTPDRLRGIVDGIRSDAARRLAPADEPGVLGDLAGRAEDVSALAAELADRLGTDLGAAIRHHGDLHLGQVVLGDDHWVILDFEGEPARPLAERRRRHSPLRDVAGMLRSFAYAAATARRSEGHLLGPGWEPAARAAFLDGYLATVHPELLPASSVATRDLLTLLELEKVVYEIGYELDHRPDWVGLPVEGLRRLLARGSA